MSGSPFDALVVGCGPAGSTAAALIARAGHDVLVLEKETFPRFHVGESLLPYNRALFDELGVWPALAGDLEPSWSIRWRLECFYLLVRLQARFGLAPRLSFAADAAPPTPTAA